MKHTAIVVAAGSGKRFGGELPKQFVEVAGKPVLAWTLQVFQHSPIVDEIVLVTAEEHIDFCREQMIEKFALDKVRTVVPGGEERTASVYAGLVASEGADIVFIHDGVRPCFDEDMLVRGLAIAQKRGAAIAAVPVRDTIKRASEAGVVEETLPRGGLWRVQTPQIFLLPAIRSAYEEMLRQEEVAAAITDDAMVMELYGDRAVHVFPGDERNIKITTPADLALAEQYLHG